MRDRRAISVSGSLEDAVARLAAIYAPAPAGAHAAVRPDWRASLTLDGVAYRIDECEVVMQAREQFDVSTFGHPGMTVLGRLSRPTVHMSVACDGGAGFESALLDALVTTSPPRFARLDSADVSLEIVIDGWSRIGAVEAVTIFDIRGRAVRQLVPVVAPIVAPRPAGRRAIRLLREGD